MRIFQSTRIKSSHKKKSRILLSASEALSEASPSESSASSNTSPIEGKSICDKYQDYNSKPASLPDFNCFHKSVATEECNPDDNSSVNVRFSVSKRVPTKTLEKYLLIVLKYMRMLNKFSLFLSLK